MKKLLALLTIMLMAGSALAQADDGDNGIGLYTGTAALSNCRTTWPSAGGSFKAYLLVTNLQNANGISGYECGIDYVLASGEELADPPAVAYPTNWMNVMSWPNFQCAGTAPIAYAPIMLLATLTIYNIVGYDEYDEPIGASSPGLTLIMGPCNPTSFGPGTLWPQYPAGPGYADGLDAGILAPLVPSCDEPAGTAGWYKVYTAALTCVVDNETSSWTNMKNLYK